MVKASPTVLARPTWYDRNPTQRVNLWALGGAAPHSITERLSYTVPAGKKAIAELLQLNAFRLTAASTLGICCLEWRLTPSGGSEITMLRVYIYTNNVGDQRSKDIAGALTLLPGDTLKAYTSDASTGGSVSYDISYKITEFDA